MFTRFYNSHSHAVYMDTWKTKRHTFCLMLLIRLSLFFSMWQKEDCSSDRILSKRELLESLMPALKGLVLGTSQPWPNNFLSYIQQAIRIMKWFQWFYLILVFLVYPRQLLCVPPWGSLHYTQDCTPSKNVIWSRFFYKWIQIPGPFSISNI